MHRSARIALVFGGLMFGFTAPAFAQTATANLSVTASVPERGLAPVLVDDSAPRRIITVNF
jgi:hypothetical protein